MDTFCPRCGAGLTAGSVTCAACGANLGPAAQQGAGSGAGRGGNRWLLVGLVAGFVALVVAVGVVAWILTSDDGDDTASRTAAPAATTVPTTTSTTTSTTTTTAPSTTTTLRRQAPPPDQTVPAPAPPGPPPPTMDRSGEAMEWVYDALVACIPDTASTIASQDAIPLGGERYRVETTMTDPVMGDFVVAYEVDFATEDFPEITPLSDTAAEFICR